MNMNAVAPGSYIYSNFAEIEYLIREFESGTLPRDQWTHCAHLTIACWYLICYPVNEATRRIREGIQKYNDAVGILNTRASGYHETITMFWIFLIKHHLSTVTRERSLVCLINGLLVRFAEKDITFEYYSRDRLMSWEARTGWIEPDLKPLPAG
jgi:hypothetical protein